MSRRGGFEIDVLLDDAGMPAAMSHEVREGLLGTPKRLPTKHFYDERGSRLFERITTLPEYYLTRSEEALLAKKASEIARLARPEELVELGSGTAKKTRLLIDAARAQGPLRSYLAVEASQEVAKHAAHDLARSYPGLGVRAVIADFKSDLEAIPAGGRRLAAFLGSTLGNFPPPESIELLSGFRALLGDDDYLLLGTDLVKDKATLEAAYNDSEGVTAEFNLNILNVINQHFDGDLDTRGFAHVAFYNEEKARIETYLRSLRDQSARLGALDIDVSFEHGEMLGTEVSCKYTHSSVTEQLAEAGLDMKHWFVDPEQTYALSLSRSF